MIENWDDKTCVGSKWRTLVDAVWQWLRVGILAIFPILVPGRQCLDGRVGRGGCEFRAWWIAHFNPDGKWSFSRRGVREVELFQEHSSRWQLKQSQSSQRDWYLYRAIKLLWCSNWQQWRLGPLLLLWRPWQKPKLPMTTTHQCNSLFLSLSLSLSLSCNMHSKASEIPFLSFVYTSLIMWGWGRKVKYELSSVVWSSFRHLKSLKGTKPLWSCTLFCFVCSLLLSKRGWLLINGWTDESLCFLVKDDGNFWEWKGECEWGGDNALCAPHHTTWGLKLGPSPTCKLPLILCLKLLAGCFFKLLPAFSFCS